MAASSGEQFVETQSPATLLKVSLEQIHDSSVSAVHPDAERPCAAQSLTQDDEVWAAACKVHANPNKIPTMCCPNMFGFSSGW